jgi:hypothetical protein
VVVAEIILLVEQQVVQEVELVETLVQEVQEQVDKVMLVELQALVEQQEVLAEAVVHPQ